MQSYWFQLRFSHFLAALLLAAVAALPAPASEDGSAPAAIRSVLVAQAAAWNRGDLQGFMRGYEDSPQTALVGPTIQYGYASILNRYRNAYGQGARMGTLSFANLHIRMLGKEYAVVTGNFQLEETKAAAANSKGVFSLVFAHTAEGWKIVVDHTCGG